MATEDVTDSHEIDIIQKPDEGLTTKYEEAKSPKINASMSAFDTKGVTLRWNAVSLDVTLTDDKETRTKQILSNISGEAVPGELLVIMGPSGAGKVSVIQYSIDFLRIIS